MSLEEMRSKVIFHNSVDVWISLCAERSTGWEDPAEYKKFIAYLLENNLNLKAFNLCAHEAGAEDDAKTRLADSLAETKDDPNSRVYTIKLADSALEMIRKYVTS
ncbi:MAG: hypothetical protein EB830_02305 [Nitrosopumilus sp. H13]|nr:MAG: hypothetical protein EB830_02305 [Nitrosopumilus sp. H13]